MAALVNTSAAMSMATMMISELSSVVFAWILNIPIGSVIITRKRTTRQLRRPHHRDSADRAQGACRHKQRQIRKTVAAECGVIAGATNPSQVNVVLNSR